MYGWGTLYGVDSAPEEQTALQLDLRPVLALKARVALIRDVPKGSIPAMDEPSKPNGTAGSLFCRLAMPMACRGFIRWESGEFTAPIFGRICMDQLAVDITDAPGVAVGDIATLVDNRKDSRISAPRIAEQAGSISNELLSRMGNRLPIVIKE